MAQLASGNVADRPLPHTIYAIAAKRFSGQLTLVQGGRSYDVGWHQGYAVCAQSSDPGDTVGRIALTAGLITSTQLGMALRAHTQDPERSLLELLVETASLTDDHARALATKAFAQAAVRPFSLHEATFSLDDELTVSVAPGTNPIDPRWLIFHGLRTQYGVAQLRRDLASVAGRRLGLANAEDPGIRAFGLDDVGVRLVHALQAAPRTVEELLALEPAEPEATPLALVYALLVTKYATAAEDAGGAASRRATTSSGSVPSVPAVTPPSDPQVLAGSRRRSSGSVPAATVPTAGARSRTRGDSSSAAESPAPAAGSSEPGRSATERREASRTRRVSRPRAAAADPDALDNVRNLVSDKLALIKKKADHFQILGLGRDATDDDVRVTYFGLARRLHPDRLRALQLTDLTREAHQVFARVNQAFSVLSNKTKRAKYLTNLTSGKTKESEAKAEAMAQKIFGAEHAFQQGMMEIRRRRFGDAVTAFAEAVELNPEEGEHHAMLGWAEWCTAEDKEGAYRAVKKRFDRAMALSPKCVPAWFYRGQVSKQLGKTEAAQECFQKVLELEKDHKDAQLELRLLERRAAEEAKPKKGGLFDRLKRR